MYMQTLQGVIYDRRHYFAPRTQEEAGINEVKWEKRMTPYTPWSQLIVRGVLIAIVGMALFAMVVHF